MTQATTFNGGVQLASSTPIMKKESEAMRRCIQDCLELANICDQMLLFCIEQGGKHADPQHINLLRDCAESCIMSASMMARHSRFHGEHCELCAEICGACAQSCEKLGDAPEMKGCAEACRRCEQSCRQMAD
jgi:hypothetical protein